MRKALSVGIATALVFLSIGFVTAESFAAPKREKFGTDRRHEEWKSRKWETSRQTIVWRMSDPWGDQVFHDVAIHFADSVKACSGGRLEIQVFPTGAIARDANLFDAVSSGAIDVAHSWPGYWGGKDEAFRAFGSVPFGLDFEGYNIWHYERDGGELLNELCGIYGLVALPCGNGGPNIGLYSNKRITSMANFRGTQVRALGWYMDILGLLGASVSSFPVGEIYLSMDRGIIDAFEFGIPAEGYAMGFQDIAHYVIEPGVPEPSCQLDLLINKKKWEALPDDLKAIVETCAKETQLWSYGWIQNLDARAIALMGNSVEFVFLDDAAVIDFAKTSFSYLENVKARNAEVKRVLDSQEKFKKDFAEWRRIRGRTAPWPMEMILQGTLKQ